MRVFKSKNIPFRSFEVLKKNEETLGELFTFFITQLPKVVLKEISFLI